ncbi:restriction endonuclease subunit S [Comamonas sp. C11]|uniref:restriction endonuclease subunit S n=1 Tax=Comamonas sp. C11 TaxID=2966554 RepID=UPI002111F610|nr:restriction endonuclease subunit S [Comamonas sp. C11]UUC91582.1 restriction endonuclease subunit S [Comamonas sp. C11]
MLNTSNDQRKLLPNFDQLFATTAQAPGGVARLRELILTLAVQGKLVAQDANDEPASELLKKIRAEKERLIAEGKIKKDKPLAAITEDEKSFELPAGWEWVRIPEITYGLGQGEPSKSFTYIDVASVNNLKGVINSDVKILDASEAPSRARKNVKVGTVIYSTVRPYLKNIAIIENNFSPEPIASTAFAVMHPFSGVASKYLLHYMRSQIFTEYVSGKAIGIAYPAINDANFFQGVVPLPPEQEQSRIVARVEELMRLCDAVEEKGQLEHTQHQQLLQAMLDSLTQTTKVAELAHHWQRLAQHFDLLIDRPEAVDALEQTILQLAVRGLLVEQDANDEPASELLKKIRTEKDRLIAEGKIKRDKPLPTITDEEKSFELPEGWEWVRLQSAFDVRDGTHDTPKYQSVGFPLVTSKNIYGGRLDLSDVKLISKEDHQKISERSRVERNDILFAMIGSIGNPVIVNTDIEFSVKNVALFKYYSASLSCPEYLLMVLQTESEGMRARAAGGVQSFVSLGQLRANVVPLPPLAEQSRIVARVTNLRALCQQLRDKLSHARCAQTQLAQAWVEQAAV